jgi:lysophospholipase L1-like esterase
VPDTPEDDDEGPRRPSAFELVAGAVVVIVAVVVGGILLIESDVGGLVGGEDDNHIDVALVGDSFLDQSHPQFLELAERRDLNARVYAYGGTSICGWQDELHKLAKREPDVLVLSFAGNDLQPCINPTGETRDPETVAADYGQDINGVVDQFRASGTEIYVVDPPPIRDPQFEANAEAMREMYRDVSIDHPRVQVIDTEPRLGPDGQFHAALPCQSGDQDCRADGTVVLRQDDGIHLTPAGGRRYARSILDELARNG